MAYGKMQDMLDLALELPGQLPWPDHRATNGTNRPQPKTVERMLNGLLDLGLKVEPSRLESDHHLTKRWQLQAELPGFLLNLQQSERSALERHLQTLSDGITSRALAKLLANQKPLSNHLAIDEEELIARTAHIDRTGPRTRANEAHMPIFERAIQGFEKLEIRWSTQGRPRASWRKVTLDYLADLGDGRVASGQPANQLDCDLIEDAVTVRLDFLKAYPKDMKRWAAESFGIYHGDEILNIRLLFVGGGVQKSRKSALSSQPKNAENSAWSLVDLRCQGHRELIHELCHPDWLGQVRIESPESLRQEFNDYLVSCGA